MSNKIITHVRIDMCPETHKRHNERMKVLCCVPVIWHQRHLHTWGFLQVFRKIGTCQFWSEDKDLFQALLIRCPEEKITAAKKPEITISDFSFHTALWNVTKHCITFLAYQNNRNQNSKHQFQTLPSANISNINFLFICSGVVGSFLLQGTGMIMLNEIWRTQYVFAIWRMKIIDCHVRTTFITVAKWRFETEQKMKPLILVFVVWIYFRRYQ